LFLAESQRKVYSRDNGPGEKVNKGRRGVARWGAAGEAEGGRRGPVMRSIPPRLHPRRTTTSHRGKWGSKPEPSRCQCRFVASTEPRYYRPSPLVGLIALGLDSLGAEIPISDRGRRSSVSQRSPRGTYTSSRPSPPPLHHQAPPPQLNLDNLAPIHLAYGHCALDFAPDNRITSAAARAFR
jgi:hypothetical protein